MAIYTGRGRREMRGNMSIHKMLLAFFAIAIILAGLTFGVIMLCIVINPYIGIIGSILLV